MEFLKQYEILYKKAKVDLNVAKITLKTFEEGEIELDLEVIMFHLQQCAEKLLKTLLSFNKQHFTKTHNIKELIKFIKKYEIKIIENIEELVPLSYYAMEGRYAIIHDNLESADKYIKILDKFIEFVKEEIK